MVKITLAWRDLKAVLTRNQSDLTTVSQKDALAVWWSQIQTFCDTAEKRYKGL